MSEQEAAVTINVPFIRDEWLPALRNGEYQQGRRQLRYLNDTFCCLGVAGDLIVKGGHVLGIHWQGAGRDVSYVLGDPYGGHTGSLPLDALDFLGLTQDQEHQLIVLNDAKSKSFVEIADYIEREWLGGAS